MWAGIVSVIFAIALAVIWWRGRRRSDVLQGQLELLKIENLALRESHAEAIELERGQQEALFNSMIEGVLLVDADNHIRLANDALMRLFGTDRGILGRTVLEAFRSAELDALIKRVSTEGRVDEQEIDVPLREPRTVQISGSTFDTRYGRGVILVFHDVTRLKQLENTRQEFVANVSHELRTPLSLIKGYAETLIDGAKDDPAVALRFLRTIEKHADRLTYLIEDLLTISRLESGRDALNLQTAELRLVIERALDELRGRARDKTVVLENAVPDGLTVSVDADRVHQVLFNLVDNAIKYGRQEVRVVVNARTVDEKRVEVSVNDNGPGIPAEHLERVFERFYRVDKARSREQGGTGLGLAIVKHIVQSHGGEVWARSEEGKGTTFFFTLPRA